MEISAVFPRKARANPIPVHIGLGVAWPPIKANDANTDRSNNRRKESLGFPNRITV